MWLLTDSEGHRIICKTEQELLAHLTSNLILTHTVEFVRVFDIVARKEEVDHEADVKLDDTWRTAPFRMPESLGRSGLTEIEEEQTSL